MSSFRKIENIKAQIVDTERLFELIKAHPIMAAGLVEKLANLRSQLEEIPKQIIEPKIRLLFSGGAVKGSLGGYSEECTPAFRYILHQYLQV